MTLLERAYIQNGEPQAGQNRQEWKISTRQTTRMAIQEVKGQLMVGIPGGTNKWVKEAFKKKKKKHWM